MSLFDQVINPADLKAIDPAIRQKIQLGVKAGALAAAALEARQRFPARIAKPLAADAKKAIAQFKKSLRG